ncbi:MAG: glycosyltransferase family 2 protein, partial [Bifidobacteriaceae bacterium]|nr:glycosyltransferase family 2 protein [Bifidobacteriaceae bacterium]
GQSSLLQQVAAAQRVAVVIPAKNESGRIAATVASAKTIPRVDLILVVDDGSQDQTRRKAREAGAVVVRHSHNRGKAAAMETGAAIVAMRDVEGDPARLLLFLDADLGETASAAAPLIRPVADGEADFTVAVLPPQIGAAGFGAVVRLARKAIARATGFVARAPLSGQRCLTREAYEEATPLAHGWGVETAMTIDLLRKGFTIQEVECDLRHRPSGRTVRGFGHRLAQYRDVSMALAARGVKIAFGSVGGGLKRAARRGRPPVRPPGHE